MSSDRQSVHPDSSLILKAPLAKRSGGFEFCGKPIFTDTNDPDYQAVLKAVIAGGDCLNARGRFDRPGFVPPIGYIREMKRYGILPADQPNDQPFDVYAADRRYWESLWYVPYNTPGWKKP